MAHPILSAAIEAMEQECVCIAHYNVYRLPDPGDCYPATLVQRARTHQLPYVMGMPRVRRTMESDREGRVYYHANMGVNALTYP